VSTADYNVGGYVWTGDLNLPPDRLPADKHERPRAWKGSDVLTILRASRLRSLVATASVASLVAGTVPLVVCAEPSPSEIGNHSPSHVTLEATFLRSGASLSDSKVVFVEAGTPVQTVVRIGNWLYVRLAAGVEGWIHANLLALSHPAAVEAKPLAQPEKTPAALDKTAVKSPTAGAFPPRQRFLRADSVVRTALSFRGTPYRMGATGRGAFDCSGFTHYLFAQEGSSLPRTAAAQYKKGVPVPKSQLKPGDLVFFKNTYKRGVSHVGIYIGNNNFIHASSAGRGVRVDSLSKPFYVNHWAGARRPR
jgi:cell wall-associated NlpC family hydrolase